MSEDIRSRLSSVKDRIARAAERAGRTDKEITLIAVTKTFDASTIQLAVNSGALDLGENRVQEAAAKRGSVKGEGLRWHLIGHLQSNKVRQAIATFDVIQTVDSPDLVQRLDRIAGEEGKRPVVLVQVDLGHEATKTGADESRLPEIVEALDSSSNLDFRGFMTLPPFFEEPERTRSYFQRLRHVRDEFNRNREAERRLTELSMGMSHDFEVAIEEGATMVRVGTAIFGAR
ncbi:MAG TPA: YggS family pyridoxal phosphate-dependent enzyme [Blastocatellia bacterium]|jgi:pyridoxal phosphate enzyme (YggS family)|nr:YggS family pyridoxal phosphate-dependent enzyme [Blastocatellia bacterium]